MGAGRSRSLKSRNKIDNSDWHQTQGFNVLLDANRPHWLADTSLAFISRKESSP